MTNEQIKSQLLGMALAITTAIGCIAYEKLVKNCSIGIIVFLSLCFYGPFLLILLTLNGASLMSEIHGVIKSPSLRISALIYSATWVTTPIWFIITKKQGVMVGSIYEVKYIVVMAVIYIFQGTRPITLNTGIGIALALVSIYFVSKN